MATPPLVSPVTDPRAVRSRRALREALLELLKTTSLDQITIRDIAAQAGVGYATYFRHYPTKEALLDDVAAEQIHSLINLALPAVVAHDQHAASVAVFTHVNRHRALWSTLLTGGAAGTIREEFLHQSQAAAQEYLRKAREEGVLPTSALPVDVGMILIVSGTIELLAWWLRQSEPMPIERIAEIHNRIVALPVIMASGDAFAPAHTISANETPR